MPDVDVLRVGTVVDIATFKAGFNEATAVVQNSTEQMKSSFQGAGDHVVRHMGERSEAMHSIRGIGEMTGVHMPRMVARMLAGFGPVAGVMAAAFPIIGAVMLIEWITKIPEALEKTINYFRGWNEEAKKNFKEASEQATEATIKFQEFSDAVRLASATAGLSGIAKMNAEQTELGRQLDEVTKKWNDSSAALTKAKDSLKLLEKPPQDIAKGMLVSGDVTGAVAQLMEDKWRKLSSGKEIDKVKQQITDLEKETKSFKSTFETLTKKLDIGTIEEPVEIRKQIDAITAAKIAADQKVSLAHASYIKSSAEEEYKLGLISLEQHTKNLVDSENQEYVIKWDGLHRKESLIKSEESKVGKLETQKKLIELNAEEEALTVEHATALNKIDADGAEQRKKRQEDLAKTRIDIEKQTALALITNQEEQSKQAYTAHEITAAEEERQLLDEKTREYETNRQALVKELGLLKEKGGDTEKEQTVINGKLLELEMKFEADKLRIRLEGKAKERADLLADSTTEMSLLKDKSARQLEEGKKSDNDALSNHKIGLEQWLQAERAAENRWYESTRKAVLDHIKVMELAGIADKSQYRQLYAELEKLDAEHNSKIHTIDQQYNNKRLQDYKNLTTQMSHIMTTSLNSWIQGQETFTKAMQNTWNSLVMSLVNYFEEMAAKWIEQHILMAIASRIFGVQEATTNVGKGTSEAGVAGAAGVASVMMALPFPANVSVAPGVGAAAFATALGFALAGSSAGAFARGGIADEDMFAQIHASEMVLPPAISKGLQNMIGGGSVTGGAVHLNYSPTVIGDKEYMKNLLHQHSDEIGHIIEKRLRRNQLSYR